MLSAIVYLVGALVSSAVATTSTVTVTRTVTVSTCPTALPKCSAPIILNFDDITCPSICPFPNTYKSFVFNGASGWQVVNKAALPATNNQNLAVVSQPNALLDQSSGFVDFGSTGQGFTFDVVRFSFSTFVSGSTSPQTVTFLMRGTTFDGQTRSYTTTLSSGINIGPNMIDLTSPQGQALQFNNLIKLSFAAYSNYNAATGTGNPATIIFDDVSLIKHTYPCSC